jgi:hypothetical protein
VGEHGEPEGVIVAKDLERLLEPLFLNQRQGT